MKNRLKLARTVTGCQEIEPPFSMGCSVDVAARAAPFDSEASVTRNLIHEDQMVWGIIGEGFF